MKIRNRGRRVIVGILIAASACVLGAEAQTPPPAATSEAAPPAAAVPDSPGAPSESTGSPAPPAKPARNLNTGGQKMLPPCLPVRHTRPRHPKLQEERAAPSPAGPPSPAPADEVVDAQIGEIATSLGSILGKDVTNPKGEDLGRVVDLLADSRGHLRVAIIDFGGFLGVGTRRIAVDWPLLRFDPNAREKPLILSVDRQKLQSAPEYNSNKPQVLMPPAASDVPDAGQAKK